MVLMIYCCCIVHFKKGATATSLIKALLDGMEDKKFTSCW
jgi:hypothetical protein